jgi:glutathione S-transferase
MTDITVYGVPLSTFVRTVRMVLEEKGIAYHLKPLMPNSDEINALHPFGKVPAFKHGNVTLCETVAIGTYIDEVFEGPALVPADTVERAHMHKWISMYNDNGAPAMGGGLVIQRLVRPMMGEEPDEARIQDSIPKVRKCLEVYNNGLKGKDFLIGDAIGLADLFPIPMIAYIHMIPEGGELFKGLPHLARWYDAIAARDSFKNTIPDFEMLGTQ